MWFILLLGLIFGEAVADIFVKQHSLTKTPITFIIAMFFYIVANISWLMSMRLRSNLSIGANIFSVGGGLLAVLIGICIYKETLHIRQWFGVGLGVVSLCLLLF